MPRGLRPPARPLADDAIRLDPIGPGHVPAFEAMISDPEIVRHTRVPDDPPPGFAAAWVDRYVAGWQDGSRAGFAIVSHDGSFLGMAAIVDLDLDGAQGEIGYIVVEAARGRGVAGRALGLVTGWALGDLGLARVELLIDVENAASIRVAERAGYVREGVLRSYHVKGEHRADMVVYSLLPGDRR